MRGKRKDLTKPYDKTPYAKRKFKKAKKQNRHRKNSITQRLRTDLHEYYAMKHTCTQIK